MGWGPEQPDLVESVPALGRGVGSRWSLALWSGTSSLFRMGKVGQLFPVFMYSCLLFKSAMTLTILALKIFSLESLSPVDI